ncbi:MAG: class I SAM-dependent methyltransferase [Bacteroidales bacterium]|nr:class I SAM-dependent methyltransferase [Bacteroidales bacterium]
MCGNKRKARTEPFDRHLSEYEQWFIDHHFVFLSELEAIRSVLPEKGEGVEIGVGSGIFASMLGIGDGIDPSTAMREKARERNVNAIEGIAEALPYPNKSYDFALMVTTICFVDDVTQSLREAHRVLKTDGVIIVGFVDKDSPVGKFYMKNKNRNVFYRDAVFYSTEEIYRHLWEADFRTETTLQTVFGMLDEVKELQIPQKGFGTGSFVVIKAVKT